MLRSRGNRLPSERAARSRLFLVPAQRPSRLPALALAQRPRRAAPRLSPLPLSYSAAASRSIARCRHREDLSDSFSLSLSLVIPRSARKRIGLETCFLSSLPPSRILARSSLSSCGFLSSAFRDRAARRVAGHQQSLLPVNTLTHTRTPTAYPPRRIVPAGNRAFFRTLGRDSSPISFQSPVIN